MYEWKDCYSTEFTKLKILCIGKTHSQILLIVKDSKSISYKLKRSHASVPFGQNFNGSYIK